MSETPETDQFAMFLHGQRLAPDLKYVTASFSEHMEKDRNRWRSVAEQAEKALRSVVKAWEYPEMGWVIDVEIEESLSAFDSLRKEGGL